MAVTRAAGEAAFNRENGQMTGERIGRGHAAPRLDTATNWTGCFQFSRCRRSFGPPRDYLASSETNVESSPLLLSAPVGIHDGRTCGAGQLRQRSRTEWPMPPPADVFLAHQEHEGRRSAHVHGPPSAAGSQVPRNENLIRPSLPSSAPSSHREPMLPMCHFRGDRKGALSPGPSRRTER